MMLRLSDLLGVNGSSWNIVVHGSHGLGVLGRKGDYFLIMVNWCRFREPKFNIFFVINRLDKILSISGISWNRNGSGSIVGLVHGWLDLCLPGSSLSRVVDDVNLLPVFSQSWLNISVLFNDVSSYIHSSLNFFVGLFGRERLSLSGLSSSCLSVVRRNSLLSNILDNVLAINFLSYRSCESFSVDLRFSGNSGYKNFRLSSYLFSHNSWFKLDNLGSSLLPYRLRSFLPVDALGVSMTG